VIDLLNDGSGLGFGIIGGKSTGVVVKTILPGGVADKVSVDANTPSCLWDPGCLVLSISTCFTSCCCFQMSGTLTKTEPVFSMHTFSSCVENRDQTVHLNILFSLK